MDFGIYCVNRIRRHCLEPDEILRYTYSILYILPYLGVSWAYRFPLQEKLSNMSMFTKWNSYCNCAEDSCCNKMEALVSLLSVEPSWCAQSTVGQMSYRSDLSRFHYHFRASRQVMSCECVFAGHVNLSYYTLCLKKRANFEKAQLEIIKIDFDDIWLKCLLAQPHTGYA